MQPRATSLRWSLNINRKLASPTTMDSGISTISGNCVASTILSRAKQNDSLVVHEPMDDIRSGKPDATLAVDALSHPEGRVLQALGELGHHTRRRASHGALDASPVYQLVTLLPTSQVGVSIDRETVSAAVGSNEDAWTLRSIQRLQGEQKKKKSLPL